MSGSHQATSGVSLTRLSFFEVKSVPSLGSISASSASPDGTIWIGDATGCIRRYDSRFQVVGSVQPFTEQVIQIVAAKHGIVALGQLSDGSCKIAGYHLYRTDDTGGPLSVGAVRISSDVRPLCVDVSSDFNYIAVGCANGQTLVYIGGLRQSNIRPKVLVSDTQAPIVSVKFVGTKKLYILTEAEVTELDIIVAGGQSSTSSSSTTVSGVTNTTLRVVSSESACGGAISRDVVAVSEGDPGDKRKSTLLLAGGGLANGGTVFGFIPDQGNVFAIPVLEGGSVDSDMSLNVSTKRSLSTKKFVHSLQAWSKYFSVSVGGQKVIVVLSSQSMRFVAMEFAVGENSIQSVIGGAFDGRSCVIICKDSVFLLREKSVTERLQLLVEKRLFEWAIDLASSEAQPGKDKLVDIYRRYGDYYMEQERDFEKAVDVYSRALQQGHLIETSYVVNKLLQNHSKWNSRPLECVAKFLKQLPKSCFSHQHLLILIGCYKGLGNESELKQLVASLTSVELLNLLQEHPEYLEYCSSVEELAARATDSPRAILELLIACDEEERFSKMVSESFEPSKLESVVAQSPMVRMALSGLNENSKCVVLPNFDDLTGTHLRYCKERVLPHSSISANAATAVLLLQLEIALRSNAASCKDIVKCLLQRGSASECLLLCKLFGAPAVVIEEIMKSVGTTATAFEALAYPGINVGELCGAHPELCLPALGGGNNIKRLASDEAPLSLLLHAIGRSAGSATSDRPFLFGDVKNRILGEFRGMERKISEMMSQTENDQIECARMRHEMATLRKRPVVHQITGKSCELCGLAISELPAIFYKCMHSYHSHCISTDSFCQVCQFDTKHHLSLLEQKQAAVSNHDELFKKMAGSDDQKFDIAMAYLGHGLFH